MRLPQLPNPEVRTEAKHMLALGWTYVGMGGGGHLHFTHPEHGTKTLPFSPSDPRWVAAHRTQTAHSMGLSRPDLERRLGVRPPRRKGEKSKKRGGPKPRRSFEPTAIEQDISQPAPPAAIPDDHTAPINPEREAEWKRRQLENEKARIAAQFPWEAAA